MRGPTREQILSRHQVLTVDVMTEHETRQFLLEGMLEWDKLQMYIADAQWPGLRLAWCSFAPGVRIFRAVLKNPEVLLQR